MTSFSWDRAIDLNRAALLGVVVAVFRLLARGEVEGTVFLSPRSRRLALRLLVPAEAAARRLIFIFVRVFDITPPSPGDQSRALPDFSTFARAAEDLSRLPSFRLVDPRKRFDWSAFGYGEDTGIDGTADRGKSAADAAPFEPVSCTDLLHRAKAMQSALRNLKKSARRMARETAKRAAAEPGPKHRPPLRCGAPPGWLRDGREEVDEILVECQGLVTDLVRRPP